MQNAKIFKGVNLEQIKAEIERNCETPLAGDFAYATSIDTYYKFSNLTGKWEYLIDGLGSTIPMVSFGASLPQTNAASALATIVDPNKTPIVVVRDADKNEVVLHVYTPTGWVAHRDNVGTINHFDFTTFATKQDATAALPNKNPNDLIYVSGDKTLYYVDSNKQLVPVDLGLGNKQDNVGFALADIDGNGNDDVYNKLGHKLMLTDSSGAIIPIIHEGQAIPKKYLDGVIGSLTSLLTTNKGNIVSALNELYNTGNQLNADIQSKLKHLTSAEHIVEYNTGNPSDPVTSANALATITNPTEGDKALLIDKTAGKSRLEIYHNGNWLMLTDDVGGNIDLTAYQTTAQADNKYATKTALAGKQNELTASQKAVIDGNWVPIGKNVAGKGTWEWIYDTAHDETRLMHHSTYLSSELTLGENKASIHSENATDIGDITTTATGIDASVTILESNGVKKKTDVKIADNSFEASFNTKPYLATTDSGVVTKKLLDTRLAGLSTPDLTAYDTRAVADTKYVAKTVGNYNWSADATDPADVRVTSTLSDSTIATQIKQSKSFLMVGVGSNNGSFVPSKALTVDNNAILLQDIGTTTKLGIEKDTVTGGSKVVVNAQHIDLQGGIATLTTDGTNPYLANEDADIVTKKYLDTRLAGSSTGGNVDLTAYDTRAVADTKYIPKSFENFNWTGTGTGSLTKVEQLIHSDNTAVQVNHDSHNYSIVVGDYAKLNRDYSITQKSTIRLAPNEFNLHIDKPNNSADIIVDAKTSETKIKMNAHDIEFKAENGNITAVNNSGDAYVTTTDSGVLTKKYADTKLFKTNDTGHIVFNSGTASTNTKDELLQALDSFLSSVPGADINAKLLKIAGVVGAWT